MRVIDLRAGEPTVYAPEPRGAVAVKSVATGRVVYYVNRKGDK